VPVGDGEGLVRLACLANPLGPVVHRDVASVVVAALQPLPVLFQLPPLDGAQLPQRSHAQDDAVVDSVGFGFVSLAGHLLRRLRELGQLVQKLGGLVDLPR
jgi:hypothetical protein